MSPRNQRPAEWPWRHTLSEAIRSARHERGTVLLMVIGVLALLAIIGVVYATIGRADRSVSVTVQRQQRITDQSEEIAAYIAKVIGNATFAKYVEQNEVGGVERTRGYTYPWTDDRFLSINPDNYSAVAADQRLTNISVPTLTQEYSTFSPTGENTKLWGTTAATDPRNHADPYLATLEPEWLGFNPLNRSPDGLLFDIRDWRHISNLAPSGNFVNVANLRRSNNGGFDAPPGFRIGSAANIAQMSYGLTLFHPTTGDMQLATMPQLLPGVGAGNANPANPAHFSNNQVFAFRPAVADATFDPAAYEYVLNQWADADGDGFLDSRLFELTDLSQMFGAGNTSAARQVVPGRGRIRLFCAARVIDSSGKINVNVASEMVKGPWPTRDFLDIYPNGDTRYLTRDDALPPGISPGDIALNRVLRLSDINVALTRLGPGPGGSVLPPAYSGLPLPSLADSDRNAVNYSNYDTVVRANSIGDASFMALIDARRRGTTAIVGLGTTQPPLVFNTSMSAASRYQHYDIFASDPHSARTSRDDGAATTASRVLRSPFDLSDELELISFFNVNDSDTLSRLEATLGGRAVGAPLGTYSPLRENRSRSLEMSGRDEFSAADVGAPSIFQPANGQRSLLAAYTDVRHLLTTVSGGRPLKDSSVAPDPSNPALVPVNPASTDVSAALKAIRSYAEADPAVNPNPFKTARQQAIELIFKLYVNALAPYTDVNDYPSAWDETNYTMNYPTRMGLVYGGNPELAIRMAAHMTANLVDAFDRDRRLDTTVAGKGRPFADDRNDPTTVNVQLAASIPNFTLPLTAPLDAARAFNGGVNLNINQNLPTGRSRLPADRQGIPSQSRYGSQVGKMTIFGVEAQPFLTEIGTMALYTDTPQAAGGDEDLVDTGSIDPIPLFANTISIEMKPTLTPDNRDFICEVIAFQLNNPFDQDVVLFDSAAAGGVTNHKYYIEYAGRYYAFRKQAQDTVDFDPGAPTVRLRAGHTLTCYVVNPGTLKSVGLRIKRINENCRNEDKVTTWVTDDDYAGAARTWIERQLRANTFVDLPVQLTQVNPADFQPIPPAVGSATFPDMDIWGENPTPNAGAVNINTPPHSVAERRVCQLWRTLRSASSLNPGTTIDELSTTLNDPTNDLLADRMHDPSDPSLQGGSGYLFDKRKVTDSDHVPSADGGPEDSSVAATIGANTGFTAVIWSAIRRPTDVKHADTAETQIGKPGGTLDSTGRPIRGVLPPWCLEARSDNKWSTASARSLNKGFHGADDHGTKTDYEVANPTDRFDQFKDALQASNAANSAIGKPCTKKGSITSEENLIGKTKDADTNHQRDYSQVAVEFHSVGEDVFGGTENVDQVAAAAPSGTGIRRSRNPALFSRSGDFLLPLAVGPWFDPTRRGANWNLASNPFGTEWVANVNTIVADRETGWMTLSEALALACGYYSPEQNEDPFYEFGVSKITVDGPNAPHSSKSDRGHLVLNAFTPHLKIGGDPAQPLGAGVPFALSIIDQFRAAAGISSTPKLVDPATPGAVMPEQQTRETSFGGGSTAIGTAQRLSFLMRREGTLNVNTSPLTTLRALPLLTPEEDAASWLRATGDYYAAVGAGAKLYDQALNPDYDIAPTLKSYRDLTIESYRRNGILAARDINFGTGPRTGLTRTDNTQPPSAIAGTLALTTLLDPLRRESRGIKSLGELANINFYVNDPGNPPATLTELHYDANSMFRFSEPDRNAAGAISLASANLGGASNRIGQRASFIPTMLSSRTYNKDDNGLTDKLSIPIHGNSAAPHYALGGNALPRGYQEKLAIVNALTNTASVYSDVFTVYFVIHGYTPEDCDVEDSQPLVPSVAKRYVMIVDRSTVVAAGDKPRILMLKEVPMQ